jgi:hypothetical protein
MQNNMYRSNKTKSAAAGRAKVKKTPAGKSKNASQDLNKRPVKALYKNK